MAWFRVHVRACVFVHVWMVQHHGPSKHRRFGYMAFWKKVACLPRGLFLQPSSHCVEAGMGLTAVIAEFSIVLNRGRAEGKGGEG